jgi:hypothetical protein
MSDTIGRITVPSTTASQVFPLVTDFPHGRAQKRLVITHTLGAGNAKIEQRFYVGSPATRYTFKSARLNAALRLALRNFWEARQGAAGAFFYDVPNEDGSTFTRKTVCFENQALTFEDLSDSICGAGVVFVEIPDPAAAPVHSLGATVSRFPNDTLADALLDQVQEIIPLVRIRVLDPGVPDILLSDRRVTIRDSRAGPPVDSVYLPRLLRVGETGGGALVTQSIDGSSDDVTFAFGNADRVMVQVANDTQLRWARVELSLYHVGSTVRLDLWAGYILDWQSDAGPEFIVKASDVLSALTLSSPVSTISRQCWRRLGQDGCPFALGSGAMDTTHFPDANVTAWKEDATHTPIPRNQWCDLGYNTPNGCMAHEMQSTFGATYCAPQGVLLRSGSVGLTFPGVLPIIGGPVGTFVGSVSNWYPRTSIVSDSIYGGTLAEVWHHDDGVARYGLPVTCRIAAGRHEDQFYIALGIVCKGPIGAYTTQGMYDSNDDGVKETFVGSTLDGQPNPGGLKRQPQKWRERVQGTSPDPWVGPCRWSRLL